METLLNVTMFFALTGAVLSFIMLLALANEHFSQQRARYRIQPVTIVYGQNDTLYAASYQPRVHADGIVRLYIPLSDIQDGLRADSALTLPRYQN